MVGRHVGKIGVVVCKIENDAAKCYENCKGISRIEKAEYFCRVFLIWRPPSPFALVDYLAGEENPKDGKGQKIYDGIGVYYAGVKRGKAIKQACNPKDKTKAHCPQYRRTALPEKRKMLRQRAVNSHPCTALSHMAEIKKTHRNKADAEQKRAEIVCEYL